MYIFTNGDVAVCPYMVFAAKDFRSLYNPKDFMLGNIFIKDFDWEKSLNGYKFLVNYDDVCLKCENEKCKKGCYAVKISHGSKLEEKDHELCPLEDK